MIIVAIILGITIIALLPWICESCNELGGAFIDGCVDAWKEFIDGWKGFIHKLLGKEDD